MPRGSFRTYTLYVRLPGKGLPQQIQKEAQMDTFEVHWNGLQFFIVVFENKLAQPLGPGVLAIQNDFRNYLYFHEIIIYELICWNLIWTKRQLAGLSKIRNTPHSLEDNNIKNRTRGFNKHRQPTKRVGYFAHRGQLLFSRKKKQLLWITL